MPNKDPEIARQLKPEWYMKNRDHILRHKRARRAAIKAAQPPKPSRPPPTAEERAKSKDQNRKARQKYRANNLVRVRTVNRIYYYRNRDKIVQQQRDRRALAKQVKQNPFRKLRALAQVCEERWQELTKRPKNGNVRNGTGTNTTKDSKPSIANATKPA